MKIRGKGRFTFGLILIAFGLVDAMACSIARLPAPPIVMVSPSSYILVGEVTGYTEPISDPSNFRGSAIGLKLIPLVTIQFPYSDNKLVELFMFRHGADCFPEPISDKPAIGTRIRVLLNPATLVGSINRSSNVPRIQSQIFDLVDRDEPMFGFSTDSYTEFDYTNDLTTLKTKFGSPEMAGRRSWLNNFLSIETAKDLIRLRTAIITQDQDQRLRVLERLLFNPVVNYGALFSLDSDLFFKREVGQVILRLEPKVFSKKELSRIQKKEMELLAERKRLETSGEVSFLLWR